MKGKNFIRIFLMALMVAYPLFVFLAVSVFELPMSIISLGLMIIAIVLFIVFDMKGTIRWTAATVGVLAIGVLIIRSEKVLEFYTIISTSIFVVLFGVPLLRGKPIITTFAKMVDKEFDTHPGRGILERCCKGLNIAWFIHFSTSLIINILIVFGSTLKLWTIYNSIIYNIIQIILIVLHFPIIEHSMKKADKEILVENVIESYRPSDYVVGYYGDTYEYQSPENRTWKDLFAKTDASEEKAEEQKDLWHFTVSLVSKLEAGAETGMDMKKPFQEEVMRLWEEEKTEDNTFRFLPCPTRRRLIDLLKKQCAK